MLTRPLVGSAPQSESEDELDTTAATNGAATVHDQQLKNAACVGTSLMVVNSHRALVLL
jgi:hypothetical protein